MDFLRSTGVFQYEPDSQPVRQLGILIDITERKRAEEALLQANADLENRVQERTSELVGRAALLRKLAGELSLSEQRERQRLAHILHDGLQQILVGAKFRIAVAARSQNQHGDLGQVSELIDDAIETSRSLTAELSPSILLDRDLLLTLEWLVRWMHDKYELEINLTARNKIEPLTEEVILVLFQCAREILFNIVKHAGVKVARVHVEQVDGKIVLLVEDEGSGFNPNELRAEGGQARGFGLFSINERLSYMGGRMEIDSAPGQGSRFKLIVPHLLATAMPDGQSTEKHMHVSVAVSSRPKTEHSGEKKIRIILVDDHLVMRQGLGGLLRAEPDFEIVGEASDGESGVRVIRELRPDVVLMDISMPGMDGIEATRIIHKDLPEIRIIGLSMFHESERAAAMREAGAVNYLAKTDPSETVVAAIRACAPRAQAST
jgi:signal transduction histidine kinase/CheY-like chemotaxis protein